MSSFTGLGCVDGYEGLVTEADMVREVTAMPFVAMKAKVVSEGESHGQLGIVRVPFKQWQKCLLQDQLILRLW